MSKTFTVLACVALGLAILVTIGITMRMTRTTTGIRVKGAVAVATTEPPPAPAPIPSIPDTAYPTIPIDTTPSTTLPKPRPTTTTTTTAPDTTDRTISEPPATSGLDPDGKPWPSPADTDWDIWMRMARCETNSNWAMHGSRFSGGLGFYNGTWSSYGGAILGIGNAGDATIQQQIWVARRVRDRHGYGGWGCAPAIGVG